MVTTRGLSLVMLVLVVGSCGITGGAEGSTDLTTVTFPALESSVLDAQAQADILAGRAAGPDYNSDPPTSGPHADDYADCGVYRVEIPDIYQVHSLKRGTVIIQYQPTLQPATRQSLEELARSLGDGTIVAPRTGLTSPIVLTAWARMLALADVEAETIRQFHDQYGQAAPNNAPCPMTVTLAE